MLATIGVAFADSGGSSGEDGSRDRACRDATDSKPGQGDGNGNGNGNGKGKGKAPCPPAEPEPEVQDLPAPFTEVTAFATKTGFRGVVTWSAEEPVLPVVNYGTDPAALDQVAPTADVPDTAGMTLLGDGRIAGLEVGETYYVSVTDQLTGVSTPPVEFVASNAYNDYGPNVEQDPTEVSYKTDVYTIDLLVQLDAQALEDGAAGLGLDDLAAGVNVFAERLYDALDGHARIGNVLITDTNVYGAGALGTFQPIRVRTCDTPTNVADVLVSTNMPFDSHTYSYSIEEPCTPFYLGRVGQLVVPWEDDLHLGHVATHEMMHYAFGAPDLYGAGDVTGTGAGGCRNLDWDGSLMHNSGGWVGDRWELTEVDRDPQLTPCDHGSEPYTWDQIQSKYLNVPDSDVLEDVHNSRARGNPDGGALDIMVLDREPGASTLTHVQPDDGDAGPVCTDGATTTSFADDTGDATSILGVAEAPAETNEPALDIVAEDVTLSSAADSVDFILELDDLSADPPRGAVGEHFDIAFTAGGTAYNIEAAWDRTTEPTYRLTLGVRGDEVGSLDGAWNVADDTVTVTVPTQVVNAGDTPDDPTDDVVTDVFTPGDEIRGFETIARRDVGFLVPDADTASGGCALTVPGGDTGEDPVGEQPTGPDATLTEASPSHAWEGEATTAAETFLLGPVAVTGTAIDETDVDVVASDGDRLLLTVAAGPASYIGVELRRGGQRLDYAESPAGGTVTFDVPATSGRHVVLVHHYAAIESTYTGSIELVPGTPQTGTPDGTANLGPGQSETFEGVAPADNVGYTCSGPFDPRCRTYVIDVAEPGTLTAAVEATLPTDDFDLSIYASDGSTVASGGLPLTPPAGLESVEAAVGSGVYYLVVQPYVAVADHSAFTATVSLS